MNRAPAEQHAALRRPYVRSGDFAGCLASWLGPAVIWIILVGIGLLGLGGFHYWTWGGHEGVGRSVGVTTSNAGCAMSPSGFLRNSANAPTLLILPSS